MPGPRISREKTTIAKMIHIYCQEQHNTKKELCSECQGSLDYALQRLDHCKFQEQKPVCAKCGIHCYRADMREAVIAVMRYAGPRMIYRHPALALLHLFDTFRGGNHRCT